MGDPFALSAYCKLHGEFGLESIPHLNRYRAIHAVLLITSPLQAVYKWHRRQSSDSDTPLPYICAIIGSLLWLRYSIFIYDWKLILLQSYAVLMQTFFVFAMLFYRSKKRRLFRSIMAIFIGIAVLFFLIAQLPPKIGLQFTGVCASGAQILGSFVCPYLIAISSKFIDFIPVSCLDTILLSISNPFIKHSIL
uniref:Sugar transporter SWEET1 n=1 Tax=Globodera rostochiensis TaxID=31243 RepID=A0A914H349_GLORO